MARRLLALIAAAGIALGLLAVPAPPVARAQGIVLEAPPIMYITPACIYEVGSQSLTIRGRNFQPNVRVQVSLAGNLGVSAVTDTSAYGTFTTTLTVEPDPYGNVHLEARIVAGGDVPPPVADAYIHGCGSNALIVATPNCGDAADPSIRVHGERFPFGTDIFVGLTQGEVVLGQTVTIPAGGWSFDTILRPGVTLEPGEYTVSATQSSPPYTIAHFQVFGYDTFIVPCPQATISPTCAKRPGGPPDQLSIDVTGISGWLRGTLDGSDEIEVVFDPYGEAQEFFYYVPYGEPPGIGEDGSFGTLTINPYARPRGTYTIQVKQQGYRDDPADPIVDQLFTFTVPCVRPVLRVDETCGPPQILGDIARNYALTLTAIDFPRGKALAIFDPEGASGVEPTRMEFVISQPGDFNVPFDVPYRQPGRYRIEVTVDTGTNIYSARTRFDVPCAPAAPTITLEPPCGIEAFGQPEAYQISITGAGFVPGPVELVFDPNGTPELGPPVSADEQGILNAVLVASGRPPNSYDVLARQTTALGVFDEVSAVFLVGCDGPVLTITPDSGPSGFVPLAEGTGFTASTIVRLEWDFGIGAHRPVDVTTDANGHFTKQMVIYQHDFLGLRQLSVHNPNDPLAYAGLTVEYLVTAGSVSPPFFVGSPTVGAESIVLRR